VSAEVRARDGLRLEVAGREIAGGLRPPSTRGGWNYLLGLPALVLLVLLMAPMAWTLVWALSAPWGAGNFVDVLTDPDALSAAWHSVVWVVIGVVLLVAAYVIAVLSRVVSRLWRVLLYLMILPFGVSAMVSGAVFRMIFDPEPERGTASALVPGITWLGPDLIWWVLGSAFTWSWLGFAVVLFRAGLDANTGLGHRFGRLTLPRVGPAGSIVVLTVLVAAIRVFDLVLIAAPGSIFGDVDVVGLLWWRMTTGSTETGAPAALAVLLFAVVAVLSLFGTRGIGRGLPAQPVPMAEPSSERTRWWSWVIGVVVCLMWTMPLVVLVGTAFHTPAAAGTGGWWRLDGLGFASFAAVADTWLWPALMRSMSIAVPATVLVVACAVPAAYMLTWRLPSRVADALTVLLGVLAVAPVQMYAGPLSNLFAGSPALISLVHAAAGLPFATLVLRAAFAAAPRAGTEARPSLDAVWRRGRYRPALVAVTVLEFVLVWNDFIVSFLIGGPADSPLALLLWGEARQFATSSGPVAAGAVVSALIPVVILLATWRTVVTGLTGGMVR